MRPAILALLVALACGCRHQFPTGPADVSLGDGRADLSITDGLPDVEVRRALEARPLYADRPSGPLVTWSSAGAVGEPAYGKCPTGSIVGGGGSCATGIDSLLPDPSNAYWATCEGSGTSQTMVYFACASPALGTIAIGTGESCGLGSTAGKLVGGGCRCAPSAKIVASYPDGQGQKWICRCAGGLTPETFVVCAMGASPAVTLAYRSGSCTAGTENIVGGGCDCTGSDRILASYPEPLATAPVWKCNCGSTTPAGTFAICGRSDN